MIMFAITHINQGGIRQLTFGNQGRNHYNTQKEAEEALELFRDGLKNKILFDMANTLEVREVDCYPSGDAKGIYFND